MGVSGVNGDNNIITSRELSRRDISDNSSQNTIWPEYTCEIDEAPTTGDFVSVRREDGISFQINIKNQTITKYDSNGKVVNERAMTSEEKAIPTQELIDRLYSSKDTPEIQNDNSKPDVENRQIKEKGISGTYQFTDTEKGYSIKTNVSVSLANSPVGKAFLNGLTNQFGLVNIKPDEQGYYNFRGIKAKTYNILCTKVRTAAQQFAIHTAIYNDLQTKVKNGETLSSGEEKFIRDYNALLAKSGFTINDIKGLE